MGSRVLLPESGGTGEGGMVENRDQGRRLVEGGDQIRDCGRQGLGMGR